MRPFGIKLLSAQQRQQGQTYTPATLHELLKPAGGGDGFGTLPVVYGCVRLISARLATLPRRVLTRSSGAPAPIPAWLEQPNKYLTGGELITGMVWSLLLNGNAFVLPVRTQGRTTGLVLPHPAQVGVHSDLDGNIIYTVCGQRYTDEVIHAKHLAVPNELRGVAPIEAARIAVESGQASQTFVRDQFKRSATMNYALVAKDPMDDEDKRRLAAQIQARHHGANNAYLPLVLDNQLDIKALSVTAEQAQFLQLSTMTAATIAGQVFGVDPSLLGIVQQGTTLTYQNRVDRDTNLWTDALEPIARIVEQALSKCLPPTQAYDIDERPLLLGTPRDRANLAKAMTAVNVGNDTSIFSPAEIRGVLGY